MFTENFFTKLLDLEDGWIVESIETDLSKTEIYIHIVCLLDEMVDVDTDEFCKVYDFGLILSLVGKSDFLSLETM